MRSWSLRVMQQADRLQIEAGPSARGLAGKAFMSRLVQPSGDASEMQPLSPAAKLDTSTLCVYFMKYFQKNVNLQADVAAVDGGGHLRVLANIASARNRSNNEDTFDRGSGFLRHACSA